MSTAADSQCCEPPSPEEGNEQCESVAAPPKKGMGKGKGKAPGKAPPLPGCGKAPPAQDCSSSPKCMGKGKGKAPGKAPPPPMSKVPPIRRMEAAAAVRDQTLFGRKLHWIKPGYQDPADETLFHDLANAPEDPCINSALLTAVFSDTPVTSASQRSGQRSTPLTTPRRASGMALLDSKRAQNMGIVFGQLKSSTEMICDHLRSMDFSEPLLNADQVDLVLGALPTSEEATDILAFAGKKEMLRDVERKVLPFCEVPNCDVRLRLLRTSLTHLGQYESIAKELHKVQLACKQLQESKLLRRLFAAALETGNLINGVAQTPRAVRSFAIETLCPISTFKIGEKSMLHFLCITLYKSDPCFLQSLMAELGSLRDAARTKLDALREEVDCFRCEAISVDRDVNGILDGNAGPCLRRLCFKLRDEATHLQELMTQTQNLQISAQVYFGAAGKLPPSDVFFGYFTEFLSSFASAWDKIARSPQKWRQFSVENSGSRCGGTSPEARMQKPQASEPSTPSTIEPSTPLKSIDHDVRFPTSSSLSLGSTPETGAPSPTDSMPVRPRHLSEVEESETSSSRSSRSSSSSDVSDDERIVSQDVKTSTHAVVLAEHSDHGKSQLFNLKLTVAPDASLQGCEYNSRDNGSDLRADLKAVDSSQATSSRSEEWSRVETNASDATKSQMAAEPSTKAKSCEKMRVPLLPLSSLAAKPEVAGASSTNSLPIRPRCLSDVKESETSSTMSSRPSSDASEDEYTVSEGVQMSETSTRTLVDLRLPLAPESETSLHGCDYYSHSSGSDAFAEPKAADSCKASFSHSEQEPFAVSSSEQVANNASVTPKSEMSIANINRRGVGTGPPGILIVKVIALAIALIVLTTQSILDLMSKNDDSRVSSVSINTPSGFDVDVVACSRQSNGATVISSEGLACLMCEITKQDNASYSIAADPWWGRITVYSTLVTAAALKVLI